MSEGVDASSHFGATRFAIAAQRAENALRAVTAVFPYSCPSRTRWCQQELKAYGYALPPLSTVYPLCMPQYQRKKACAHANACDRASDSAVL